MDIEYFLGIDNASKGALAIIKSNLEIVDVLKYPENNLQLMYDFLKPYAIHGHIKAVLESPFRSMNIGMEKTFQIAGHHEMNLNILNIPFEWAEPRINMKTCWRNEFNFKCLTDKEFNKQLRQEKKLSKQLKIESIQMTDLLFDGKATKWLCEPVKNSKTGKLKKADDNCAEALLLAVYAERMYNDNKKSQMSPL